MLQSKVTQGFWKGLSDFKLETLRLSEDPLDILGRTLVPPQLLQLEGAASQTSAPCRLLCIFQL